MPFVATTVIIPEAIRPILSKFAKSRTLPARQVQRAKIILLAADGLDNMQISGQVSLSQDSVSKWRCRFIKSLPLLQEVAEKKLPVAALLAAPDPSTGIGRRDLIFMILLYATATRLDEILSIKVGHLKLDAGKPHVTITGKGGKMRTLYLLPKAVSHVRRYIREVHDGGTDPDAYFFSQG